MSAGFRIGERIYLRAPEKGDIDLFLKWINDPEIHRFVLRYRPLGREEEEEWLAGLPKRQEDVVFVIVRKEKDEPIGSCGLHRISLPNRSAELGITIGEKRYWSQGYGREAMGLLCGYGFESLNLNRIGLSVYEYNPRGQRCYEKLGFRIEGRRRQARFWDGRYWDVLEMGLLVEEWHNRGGISVPRELCQVNES